MMAFRDTAEKDRWEDSVGPKASVEVVVLSEPRSITAQRDRARSPRSLPTRMKPGEEH